MNPFFRPQPPMGPRHMGPPMHPYMGPPPPMMHPYPMHPHPMGPPHHFLLEGQWDQDIFKINNN